MYDAHAAVRAEISALIARAGFVETRSADISTVARQGAIFTALPLSLGLDAGQCLGRIQRENAALPATLLDEPLILDVSTSEGYLHFRLRGAALGAMMQRIIAETPLPPPLESILTRAEYAYMRMRMLAREGGNGCPDDEAVRRALWLALGIVGSRGRARPLRLLEASEALLTMTHGLRPRDRAALYRRCADVGGCSARILYGALRG